MVYAIDGDIKEDAYWGIGLGVFFIMMNIFFPNYFFIGYPGAAISGDTLTAVLLAPFAEEFMFRGILLSVIDSFGLFFPLGIIINAAAFAFFHWSVYGLAVNAAMVGAFIFSILAVIITRQRESLVPAIIFHVIVNFYLKIVQPSVFLGFVQ